jgi:hypothetical protein
MSRCCRAARSQSAIVYSRQCTYCTLCDLSVPVLAAFCGNVHATTADWLVLSFPSLQLQASSRLLFAVRLLRLLACSFLFQMTRLLTVMSSCMTFLLQQ